MNLPRIRQHRGQHVPRSYHRFCYDATKQLTNTIKELTNTPRTHLCHWSVITIYIYALSWVAKFEFEFVHWLSINVNSRDSINDITNRLVRFCASMLISKVEFIHFTILIGDWTIGLMLFVPRKIRSLSPRNRTYNLEALTKSTFNSKKCGFVKF